MSDHREMRFPGMGRMCLEKTNKFDRPESQKCGKIERKLFTMPTHPK